MNERIKELTEQAKQWANSIPEFWDTSVDRDMLFQKKFAELIIRECMNVVRGINQEYDGGSTVVNAADEIKEHFGVEE